jgi:general secretion pathway protein J
MWAPRIKQKHKGDKSQAGFTLIEVLVGLFVLSLIATAGSAILVATLATQARFEATAERTRELDLFRVMIRNDLAEAVDRPVRTGFGDQESGMFGGFPDQPALLSLSRLMPDGSVVRVDYVLRDAVLWRDLWPRADRAPQSSPTSLALLGNVEEARIAFRSGPSVRLAWGTRNGGLSGLPEAVSFQITLKEFGSLEHLVLVAGARS